MEILAPAGNMAGVIAAINGGADAVYLGGKRFNARQRAENFDHEGLKKIIGLCHDHGVKVYLTLNILIKDKEMQEALDEARLLWQIGADALIVQDPGLIFLLRRFYPQIELQTSTQASVFGLAGVRFFENLGFKRVVLPREMSLGEVRKIKAKTAAELKVFGHGALCYAYSGQCLFSSLIGGRSGNRGCCAQPCRKKYRLKTMDGRILQSGYLMSMKDLNTRQSVQEIAAAGVTSLKIEGRMKGPAYIYAASEAYSQTLSGHKPACDDAVLRQIFNRDFTGGCLLSDCNRINPSIGRNKGIEIGRILDCRGGKLFIQLKAGVDLHCGDGLSFGKDAQKGMKILDFTQKGRDAVILTQEKIQKGQSVFRTFDAALQQALGKKAGQIAESVKTPVDVHLQILVGQPVQAEIICGEDHLRFLSTEIPSLAQNAPVTEAMARAQNEKMGGSRYVLRDFSIDTDGRAFLSKGALNAIRRVIIDQLDQKREGDQRNKRILPVVSVREILPLRKSVSKKAPLLSLLIPEQCCEADCISAWLNNDADEVVVPLLPDLKKTQYCLIQAKDAGKQTVLSLPRIMDTASEESFAVQWPVLKTFPADLWYCPHYEGLQLLRDKGLTLEAGSGMHLFNRFSAEALKNWGFSSAELSPELTGTSAGHIAEGTDLDCILTVFGHREMMVSKNCLLNCQKKDCENCREHHWYFLEDERGAKFPFYRDLYGTIRIFNGDTLFLKKTLEALKHMAKWRINATIERAEEIRQVIAYYKNEGLDEIKWTDDPGRLTTGNYKREVE